MKVARLVCPFCDATGTIEFYVMSGEHWLCRWCGKSDDYPVSVKESDPMPQPPTLTYRMVDV
jgi:transposase-like protein